MKILDKKNKIYYYPTWVLPDGKKRGLGSVEEIAKFAGCRL